MLPLMFGRSNMGRLRSSSNADAALVVPELLRTVPKWVEERYEAVIIGCFSDPGIAAIRDVTDIPVIGPGGSAMHLAAQFGERFSVLSSDPTPKGLIARLRSLGLAELFVSERMVGCSVLDWSESRTKLSMEFWLRRATVLMTAPTFWSWAAWEWDSRRT